MAAVLCIALLSGTVMARLEVADFTLSWRHSIEKIEWQEDWHLDPAGLELVRARVRGSGAGMDPPADAAAIDGWWQYDPHLAPVARLTLARSGMVPDHLLCIAGECRPLGTVAGNVADDVPLVLSPCGAGP
ncbi:DUF1850 domain-containing protein [Oleomonas cavernae]|uniref:DUF1850 domain-containing protein n=1 Tax=Oleomonas cavernae TaxID=2320859 RepID=A0A418WE59_9PROT|nr:DUF1850 domain-containing protein [Oleomonas cavernae]RJF88292.1 DUF1850 domain-containing protein [Oleomonas cavernae]